MRDLQTLRKSVHEIEELESFNQRIALSKACYKVYQSNELDPEQMYCIEALYESNIETVNECDFIFYGYVIYLHQVYRIEVVAEYEITRAKESEASSHFMKLGSINVKAFFVGSKQDKPVGVGFKALMDFCAQRVAEQLGGRSLGEI